MNLASLLLGLQVFRDPRKTRVCWGTSGQLPLLPTFSSSQAGPHRAPWRQGAVRDSNLLCSLSGRPGWDGGDARKEKGKTSSQSPEGEDSCWGAQAGARKLQLEALSYLCTSEVPS